MGCDGSAKMTGHSCFSTSSAQIRLLFQIIQHKY
jgi:hypothetical protein